MNQGYKIGEFAKRGGISIRTLHHYDRIGLLHPVRIDPNGYRWYDEDSADALQQILLYRELDFPLEEIRSLIHGEPDRRQERILHQRELLALKQRRLKRIQIHLDRLLRGEDIMEFKDFDMTPIEEVKKRYNDEAAERWGNTDAYRESSKRTKAYGKAEWATIQEEAHSILKGFQEHKDQDPASKELQDLVRRWQEHISQWYYPCSLAILKGLGEMYMADERFQKNLDKSGEGTARIMSLAIAAYDG